MKILEEFWYGNIEPTDYDTSSCKEYKKLQKLICRNEEKLRVAMTDEQKALFEKYTDCVREHQTITECLIFQNSFKLGCQNDVGSHGRIKNIDDLMPPVGAILRVAFCIYQNAKNISRLSKIGVFNRYYS